MKSAPFQCIASLYTRQISFGRSPTLFLICSSNYKFTCFFAELIVIWVQTRINGNNISGKVHRYNVHIWGTENPHEMVQHERASPKIDVFCAVSTQKVYGPCFFCEDTVTGTSYLEMLQTWLFPRLQED
jgi:hypothetical protein